ncbi:uncharacterized protein BJ212DRAFT_1300888 [Suillus subaureus]|uniref:Uncharacterized protein n=1 Tax=Suillus subaureus TaxID=48587 RepID=A0A9P7E8A2_9AGAM|nr:uncharacterized protein BJ212DRAFT_1300888 [Suillus subaureus]KAG1814031.1 hypothetical protein BJ212DRAFT_1300888 [Suillus subaureus]
MPNTGMHMGQLPWPQLAYIIHLGCYYPYGVPPNVPRGAAPPYAPVAPSPGADTGVAHHAFQTGQNGYYPPAVVDVTNHHEPNLTTGFAPSFVPQVPSLSVGQKRVAEDLKERDVKRTKISSDKIKDDPLFKPVLDGYGQHNGTYSQTSHQDSETSWLQTNAIQMPSL